VYWLGGMWLLSQGVGVMGGRTGGATSASMIRWGLIGAVPLILIPVLLSRRWSWRRGVLSRRVFAVLVAVLLAIRAWKVGVVAVHGGDAAVEAPWGGSITFQGGAAIFLVVTLVALAAVARAALTPDVAGESRA
jgi:hypothetical protein